MKLEVTRGIECGERVSGDESGECGFRGEWDGGVGCGSNRVKLRLNVELGVIVMEMNVELNVEMVMLKRLISPLFFLHPINNTPNNQSKPIVPLLSFSPITSSYIFIAFSYNF